MLEIEPGRDILLLSFKRGAHESAGSVATEHPRAAVVDCSSIPAEDLMNMPAGTKWMKPDAAVASERPSGRDGGFSRSAGRVCSRQLHPLGPAASEVLLSVDDMSPTPPTLRNATQPREARIALPPADLLSWAEVG